MTLRPRHVTAVLLLGLLVGGSFFRFRSESMGSASPSAPTAQPLASVPGVPRTQAIDVSTLITDQPAGLANWQEFTPETLTIRLTPSLTVPFRVTKVERDARRTVLTARIEDAATEQEGLEGAYLVATANTHDRWDATVVFPGMEYRIRVRGSDVTVEEAPNEELICLSDAESGAGPVAATAQRDIALATTEDVPTVDIVVLINEQALAERNGDLLTVDADCSNYVAASNAVLVNSRITAFVWRYLIVLQAPAYTATSLLETDLEIMQRGTLASHVNALKRTYGADHVMMLVGGIKTDAVGFASVGGTNHLAVMNYPFPTFTNGNRSTVTTSYYTFCHELAHNFGSLHGRASSDSNATDGDGRYNYGHRITDPQSTSTPVETVGTIMVSGSSYRIPFYSHPDITFRGVPIGVAVDQPTAAYNARFLAEKAAAMAASADAIAKPAILRHPESVTTTLGQTVNLSVTATGNSLTYRWSRNGSTLADATSATLTLTAITTADLGSYNVTVSNVLGSTTSNTAVVSQVAAPVPSTPIVTPTPSSSGGGGGGGAFSEGFLAALLVLAGLRRLTALKRGA